MDNTSKPLTLYCDNEPTVFYMSNNKSSVAVNHIDIQYHVVKDIIHDQTINVKHINTTNMLADPLTKGLTPNTFPEHVADMGLFGSLLILIFRDFF